jgi:hypothetical protein
LFTNPTDVAADSSLEQKNIRHKIDKISGDLKEIKAKPAKRYEPVVVITEIVTGIMTFLLTQMSLRQEAFDL